MLFISSATCQCLGSAADVAAVSTYFSHQQVNSYVPLAGWLESMQMRAELLPRPHAQVAPLLAMMMGLAPSYRILAAFYMLINQTLAGLVHMLESSNNMYFKQQCMHLMPCKNPSIEVLGSVCYVGS